MKKWTHDAVMSDADIVVFGEDFVSGGWHVTAENVKHYTEWIPEPSDTDLCSLSDPDTPITSEVACVAKENSIYLVTGIGDRGPCARNMGPFTKQPYPCPDGVGHYNTAAVFGPEGQLVAKYHKSHFARTWFHEFETQWTQADEPEPQIFEAFGVKFGMFICNDMNFGGPTMQLIEQGVTEILFPTLWVNSVPWYGALGVQDAYSRTYGVNVLGANADLQGRYSSGSGIWPADKSKEFVQRYYTGTKQTDGWMGVLELESPSRANVLKPMQAPTGVGPIVKTEEVIRVRAGQRIQRTLRVYSTDSTAGRDEYVECKLDATVKSGSGDYLFRAARGLHQGGFYTERCIFSVCQDENTCEYYIPSGNTPGGAAVFENVKITFKTLNVNAFHHTALSEDGLVMMPRTTATLTLESNGKDGVLELAHVPGKKLLNLYLDARAANGMEQPIGPFNYYDNNPDQCRANGRKDCCGEVNEVKCKPGFVRLAPWPVECGGSCGERCSMENVLEYRCVPDIGMTPAQRRALMMRVDNGDNSRPQDGTRLMSTLTRLESLMREQTKDLEEIREDIDEIEEDLDEVQEDLNEIQDGVEDIAEDIEGSSNGRPSKRPSTKRDDDSWEPDIHRSDDLEEHLEDQLNRGDLSADELKERAERVFDAVSDPRVKDYISKNSEVDTPQERYVMGMEVISTCLDEMPRDVLLDVVESSLNKRVEDRRLVVEGMDSLRGHFATLAPEPRRRKAWWEYLIEGLATVAEIALEIFGEDSSSSD